MPAELARLSRFAEVRPASAASASRCCALSGTSSSALARWLISVSMTSPSSSPPRSPPTDTPSRFMPVSTITSHGPPPARASAAPADGVEHRPGGARTSAAAMSSAARRAAPIRDARASPAPSPRPRSRRRNRGTPPPPAAAHHLARAQPIAVRLHRRAACRGTAHRRERPPIGDRAAPSRRRRSGDGRESPAPPMRAAVRSQAWHATPSLSGTDSEACSSALVSSHKAVTTSAIATTRIVYHSPA
jgi:hypothetical protein